MTDSKQHAGNDTPGKPTDSGSRQQNHPGQSTQTGSPSQDRQHSKQGGGGAGAKPAGAK